MDRIVWNRSARHGMVSGIINRNGEVKKWKALNAEGRNFDLRNHEEQWAVVRDKSERWPEQEMFWITFRELELTKQKAKIK